MDRKLEVFTDYYDKLIRLDFTLLCPHLLTARVINHKDNCNVQQMVTRSSVASYVLEKISTSLEVGIGEIFDKFLSVLKNHGDSLCIKLTEKMIRDLSQDPNGKPKICIITPYGW